MLSAGASAFAFLVESLGGQVAASLILGTAGRALIRVFLGAWTPLFIGPNLVEAAIDFVAPPPAVVLTKAASAAFSKVASNGVWVILGGIRKVLIHIVDTSFLKFLSLKTRLLSEPETEVHFLVNEEDRIPKFKIIEDYDVPDTKRDLKQITQTSNKALRPLPKIPDQAQVFHQLSQSAIGSTLLEPNSPVHLGFSSIPSKDPLSRSSYQNPHVPSPVFLECTEEQQSYIIQNFDGERVECRNLEELKQFIGTNPQWNEAVSMLEAEPEGSWISADVTIDSNPQLHELARSALQNPMSMSQQALYDSWINLVPSAPYIDEHDFPSATPQQPYYHVHQNVLETSVVHDDHQEEANYTEEDIRGLLELSTSIIPEEDELDQLPSVPKKQPEPKSTEKQLVPGDM